MPVGIDLGTTTTLAAVVDGGGARCVPLGLDGEDAISSCVVYDAEGLGSVSRGPHAALPGETVVYPVKRLIGRTLEEAGDARAKLVASGFVRECSSMYTLYQCIGICT